MLSFDCRLSGGQIGRQIANDTEEFRYMLEAVIEDAGDRFPEELALEFHSSDALQVASFLRKLADALEKEHE
jgi:hypothetical protein